MRQLSAANVSVGDLARPTRMSLPRPQTFRFWRGEGDGQSQGLKAVSTSLLGPTARSGEAESERASTKFWAIWIARRVAWKRMRRKEMTVSDQSVHLVKVVQNSPKWSPGVHRPDELVRWMHPDAFTRVSASNDPGSAAGATDPRHGQGRGGRFQLAVPEVVPGRRLVMDWQFGRPAPTPMVTTPARRSSCGSRARSDRVRTDPDRLDVPPGGPTGVSTGWTRLWESRAAFGRRR